MVFNLNKHNNNKIYMYIYVNAVNAPHIQDGGLKMLWTTENRYQMGPNK